MRKVRQCYQETIILGTWQHRQYCHCQSTQSMGQVNRKHDHDNTNRTHGRTRRNKKNSRGRGRGRGRDRNLSHSFTWPDGGAPDGVDVNLASEEQLMTIAGVSRELARNIVSHRNTIGRYRKIDDLALVSGKSCLLYLYTLLTILRHSHNSNGGNE